uniref:Uncharacterized protein n=1 Tax=uncultured Thiotrichaceae bacterium TaxID=298394 RepID=A0A6S6T722_9GAMM|nr:MAG: Unknown protein [uncultured Thiotrichaceae bacterium]
MGNKADVELLDGVRQGLTEQCDKLPDATLRRLQAMRQNTATEPVPRWEFFDKTILGMPLVPLSGALSVGVLGFAFLVSPGAGFEGDVNDTDVLMSNEDMEFLENLELYEWLDAEYG